jgi:hypothetical protein
MLILTACSSSSSNNGDQAAEEGLDALRKMAAASDFEFHGYEQATDIGNETLGDPIKVKSLDYEALLAENTPQDLMIVDKDEYIYPVIVGSNIIGCIEIKLEDGDWEFVSTGSETIIDEALNVINANSLNQENCYLLELEEIDLVFLGYADNGKNYLIPLFDTGLEEIVPGTVYAFTDIAQYIKSEIIAEQGSYDDMIPAVTPDDEQSGLSLEDILGFSVSGNELINAAGESSNNLSVTLYPQEEDEWCWAATGRMTMLYAGGDESVITECAEANDAFDQSSCCSNGGTSACNKPWLPIYEDWGFSAKARSAYLSWDSFKASIDAGKPVAFLWRWKSGGGHYQVAKGYYEDLTTSPATKMVYVNNPWPPNKGAKTSYTYDNWIGGSKFDHTQTYYFYNIVKN